MMDTHKLCAQQKSCDYLYYTGPNCTNLFDKNFNNNNNNNDNNTRDAAWNCVMENCCFNTIS